MILCVCDLEYQLRICVAEGSCSSVGQLDLSFSSNGQFVELVGTGDLEEGECVDRDSTALHNPASRRSNMSD